MKITIGYLHFGYSVTIKVTGAEGYLRATRRRLEAIPTLLQPEGMLPKVYD